MIHGTADTSRIEAPVTLKAYLMCAFAAFGGIFFGYDTGWMGGIMGMKYYIHQYTGRPYPGPNASTDELNLFVLPGWQQSLLTGILSCGTFFGAIIAGDIADRIGRRWTIISGCLTFIIGCILETASTTLAVMVVGRLIAGAGVGFISAISRSSPANFSAILPLQMTLTNSITSSHPLHVRNCPQEGPRSPSLRISVLYHNWYPSRQLRCLRYTEPFRYWLLPYSHRHSIPLGHHPCNWSFLPARVSTLLCQERQTRFSCEGPCQCERTTTRVGVYSR